MPTCNSVTQIKAGYINLGVMCIEVITESMGTVGITEIIEGKEGSGESSYIYSQK